MVRLAEEVDARRIEWERVNEVSEASALLMRQNYEQAVENLDRAVTAFNRDMSESPAGGK